MNLKILNEVLFEKYVNNIPKDLEQRFEALKDADISTDSFCFYTSVSTIASSKIEGEQMEVDSYLKHKMLNIAYQPNLVEKPNDLYKTYLFAQKNQLSDANFLQAHKILSEHLLPKNHQGVYRTSSMVVLEHNTGRIHTKQLFLLMLRD